MPDALTVVLIRYPDQPEAADLQLRVNGRELIDTAVQAGLPAPDGLRDWVYPPAHLLRTDHFFEGPDRWEDDQDSGAHPAFGEHDTALLADGCGQPGCAALLADIRVDASAIRWSKFRWYHASRPDQPLPIGPFVFHPAQYETALRNARQSL